MEEFPRIKRLPPYVLAVVTDLKAKLRKGGEDIIALGMGNPDLPTPKHIVEKLVEAAKNPRNHRYSASRGIPKLRLAICNWYKRRFDVELDPDTEAIATIGAKEGLSHLVLAIMGPGDLALVPNQTRPAWVVAPDFCKRGGAFGREHEILITHALAYAALVFDRYKAPSILQV